MIYLRHFNKQFILEGLSIILQLDYFYMYGIYIHQIKGTAMGTKFAVAGSNLVGPALKSCSFLIQRPGEMKTGLKPLACRNIFLQSLCLKRHTIKRFKMISS